MKLFVTYKMLQFRKSNPELFATGDYIPFRSGECIVAFGRRLGDRWAAVVAPRWMADFQGWGDLELPLPPIEWTDALTGLIPASHRLADILAEFPVADAGSLIRVHPSLNCVSISSQSPPCPLFMKIFC